MIRVPAKITLGGDRTYAKKFVGAGQSQLRILENQLDFRDLNQGVRRTRLDPRTFSEASVCFNLSEVKIYSIPMAVTREGKERLDRLDPRFFAYIVKVDGITGIMTKEYYWLYFNKIGNSLDEFEQTKGRTPTELSEDYELYVWKVAGSIREIIALECDEIPAENNYELVEKMRIIPTYSGTAHTKSFMLYPDDDTEYKRGIRYAAAAHLMTSNHRNIFEPLNHPNCIGSINPYPPPMYPRSVYSEPDDDYFVGLNLLHPPNRFLCNPEDKMMVWYTAKSYSPEAAGQDFVCGVYLNMNYEGIFLLKSFIVYGNAVEGEGYTPYWAIDKDRLEVPMSMLNEVDSISKEELVVISHWEGLPFKTTIDSTGAKTYEELTECYHNLWSEEGFERTLFATLDQWFEEAPDAELEETTTPGYDCTQHDGDPDGCSEDSYHEAEYYGYWQYVPWGGDAKSHSTYEMTIFDDVYTAVSDDHSIGDRETCYSDMRVCQYTVDGTCRSSTNSYIKHLFINVNAESKQLDSLHGSWINSNTAYKMRKKLQDYTDGTATFWTSVDGFPDNNGEHLEDWLDLCFWDITESTYNLITYPCFQDKATMPLSLWNALGNEVWTPSTPKLVRTGGSDTSSTPDIEEYVIDGEIVLAEDDVDKLYYLDDRATDDNQGVMAAGKGNSEDVIGGEDPGVGEYVPDYWSINWKINWNDDDRSFKGCVPNDSLEYIDIKAALLEALDCEENELIDIGLV